MDKVRTIYSRKTRTWFVRGIEFSSKLDAYRYANTLRTKNTTV